MATLPATEYSHIPEHPLRYVSQEVLDAARKCLQDHIEVLGGIAEDEDVAIVYSVSDAILSAAVGVYTSTTTTQGKHVTSQDRDINMTREQ